MRLNVVTSPGRHIISYHILSVTKSNSAGKECTLTVNLNVRCRALIFHPFPSPPAGARLHWQGQAMACQLIGMIADRHDVKPREKLMS